MIIAIGILFFIITLIVLEKTEDDILLQFCFFCFGIMSLLAVGIEIYKLIF